MMGAIEAFDHLQVSYTEMKGTDNNRSKCTRTYDLSGTKRCFQLARNMLLKLTGSEIVDNPAASAVRHPNY